MGEYSNPFLALSLEKFVAPLCWLEISSRVGAM